MTSILKKVAEHSKALSCYYVRIPYRLSEEVITAAQAW